MRADNWLLVIRMGNCSSSESSSAYNNVGQHDDSHFRLDVEEEALRNVDEQEVREVCVTM